MVAVGDEPRKAKGKSRGPATDKPAGTKRGGGAAKAGGRPKRGRKS